MKYKVGGKVRLKKTIAYSEGEVPNGTICVLAKTSDLISEIIDPLGRKWTITTESIEPVILAIDEIISKEISCVIHTKTKEEAELLADYMPQTNSWSRNPCDDWDYYGGQTGYYIADGKLAQYASISYYKANFPEYGEIYEFSDLFATGGRVSIHDLPTSEWYNPMRLTFKNDSSIEALPQKDDAVRSKNLFCTGFRGGKTPIDLPEFVFDAEQAKELAERLNKELAGRFNAFSNDGISAKNGGKNSMKFTFYFNVNEGTRVDKSCNGTIPTITTSVVLDKFGDPDRRKCYSLEGEATCDKADYDMRQGVLEALANAVFDGNFEKAYDKAVKTNAFCERQDRTCHYCGKVLDTIEEKQAHEAWHVERKKARRERYLLRKRAKEIAFEEQAQKMAKEMIDAEKGAK